MFSPIGSLPFSGTSYPGTTGSSTQSGSSSGTGSASSTGQSAQPSSSTSTQDSGPATQATDGTAAAGVYTGASPSNGTQHSAAPSRSMAQQLIDALASMADTMSAGLPGSAGQSMAAASGSPQNWAELRLERTVESYLAF